MTSFQRQFSSTLSFYAGFTLWIGGLLFFGIAVAPVIFKTLPSKDLAGALNAVILHRLNMLELAGATLIGVSFALQLAGAGSAWKQDKILRFSLIILCGMLLVWCGYALYLTAEMNALRGQINSFDTPNEAALPLVKTFRTYHQWYSRLVGANMLAGLTLLVLQTWRLVRR